MRDVIAICESSLKEKKKRTTVRSPVSFVSRLVYPFLRFHQNAKRFPYRGLTKFLGPGLKEKLSALQPGTYS